VRVAWAGSALELLRDRLGCTMVVYDRCVGSIGECGASFLALLRSPERVGANMTLVNLTDVNGRIPIYDCHALRLIDR
jgi:hypothetical protein